MVCFFVNWNVRFLVVKSNIFFFRLYLVLFSSINLICIYIGQKKRKEKKRIRIKINLYF